MGRARKAPPPVGNRGECLVQQYKQNRIAIFKSVYNYNLFYLKELCHVPDWLDKKRVDKRFSFASLSHPKFVNKLKVAPHF